MAEWSSESCVPHTVASPGGLEDTGSQRVQGCHTLHGLCGPTAPVHGFRCVWGVGVEEGVGAHSAQMFLIILTGAGAHGALRYCLAHPHAKHLTSPMLPKSPHQEKEPPLKLGDTAD